MRLPTFCILALSAAVPLMAENLVFNSSFEMGSVGYDCAKYLRADTNPGLKYEGLAIDSSTSVSGKQSLRIPNRFAEAIEFHATEFKLKPGTDYTFSLWLKSSVEKYPFRISVMNDWNVCASETLPLGKTWRRYSISFKTEKADLKNEYSIIRMLCGRSDMPADIWLDDLQIAEGPLRAYESGAAIESSVDCETLLVLNDGKASLAAKARIVNNSDSAFKGALTLKAIAVDGKTEALSKPIMVELPPKSSKTVSSEIPFAAYGFYHINPQFDTKLSHKELHATLAVIGKYERKPLDMDKNFYVGFNYGKVFRGIVTPSWSTAAFGKNPVSPGIRAQAQPDRQLELLATMGCRVLRAWSPDGFRWAEIEPEEGKFDWSSVGQLLEWKEKYGFGILPVMGGMDFMDPKLEQPYGNGSLPAWLKEKSQVQEKFPLKVKYKKGCVYLPPIELWRRYVREIALHAKGAFTHYEIMNEPNIVFLDANGYMPYLKAAYEELKAVNPECKVLAPCVTGDLGGNVRGFSAGFIKSGGLAYTDIFSFHPYDSPRLNSPVPADLQIADLQTRLKEAGKGDCPLWNTELYYLNSKIDGSFLQHQPACRFLVDLGEGLKQSLAIQAVKPFNNSVGLEHQNKRFDETTTPAAAYVIYNALARHFEGAKPLAKFKWPYDNICYVYEREGKPLAAFWNYGVIKDSKLTLKGDFSKLKLFDIFGNEQPFPADGVFKLDASPLYLESNGLAREDFLAILKAGKVEAEVPLLAGELTRLVPENGWTAIVPLRNYTASDLSGKLELKGVGIAGDKPVDFTIPIINDAIVKVPVKLTSETPGKLVAKIVVNGKLFELPLNLAPVGKVLYPGMDAQLGAMSFKATCEKGALKLSFDVKDSTPSGAPGDRQPFQQDCIEIFLDAAPDLNPLKNPELYHEKAVQLFILPYAPKGKRLVLQYKKLDVSKVKETVAVNPNGYSATLEIPLAALELPANPKGRCIGFDVKVDDAKGAAAADCQEHWNSLGDAHKNRFSFGFIAFK